MTDEEIEAFYCRIRVEQEILYYCLEADKSPWRLYDDDIVCIRLSLECKHQRYLDDWLLENDVG